ncbi:MAG: hypothetical protein Q8S32_14555 [Burkholderiaceae bacterium]|nr:hypothetical protein [Burkholderiaceae bacterium]
MDALHLCDRLAQTLGDTHPKAQAALMRVFDLAPPELHAQMTAKARELGLIPDAGGYLADGTPVYRLEDVAKQLGLSESEAQASIAQFMAERQAIGVETREIAPTLIHRVQ